MSDKKSRQELSSQKEILTNHIHWAIEELENKGYKIQSKVTFGIDPNLEIMGYTTETESGQRIVISSWALSSPMLKGLLIHELTHIVRTEEGHPSHNFQLLSNIVNRYSRRGDLDNDTTMMLRESLQHVQDIYADDIGFLVLRDSMDQKIIEEFFSNWVKDDYDARRFGDRANNITSTFASNAFALASLRRHGYDSNAETRIKKANSLFLKKAFQNASFERMIAIYSNVVDLLSSLPKSNMGEEQFSDLMQRYFDLLLIAKQPSDS